jgi:hypothetical protein
MRCVSSDQIGDLSSSLLVLLTRQEAGVIEQKLEVSRLGNVMEHEAPCWRQLLNHRCTLCRPLPIMARGVGIGDGMEESTLLRTRISCCRVWAAIEWSLRAVTFCKAFFSTKGIY